MLRKTVELCLLAWRFDFSPCILKSLDLPRQSAIFLYRRNLTRGYSLITLSRLKSRFFPFLSYSLVSFIHRDKSPRDRDRVMYFRMIHLFRIRHDLAPGYLKSNFTLLNQSHSYSTRGSGHNFHLSKEISRSPTAFTFLAIKQWNSLPNLIKESSSLVVFKKKLKDFLISSYD